MFIHRPNTLSTCILFFFGKKNESFSFQRAFDAQRQRAPSKPATPFDNGFRGARESAVLSSPRTPPPLLLLYALLRVGIKWPIYCKLTSHQSLTGRACGALDPHAAGGVRGRSSGLLTCWLQGPGGSGLNA